MIKSLCFKGQALDNMSPDQYEIDGNLVPEHEQQPRNDVTALISEISRSGSPILSEGGVEIIVTGPKFLVQLYSEQRDSAGRRAPIMVCGTGDPIGDRPAILHALGNFAGRIGRTLDPDHLRTLRDFELPVNRDAVRAHGIPQILAIAATLLVVVTLFIAVLHFSQAQV